MPVTSQFSLVLEVPAAAPEDAHRHFASKLSMETDPSDVMLDLQRGQDGFVIMDVRGADDYADCHIDGAIHLPYRQINADTTKHLSKDKVIVTYCWGPGCNASTKGALRLASLGFRVKEMIGGLEYWKREAGKVAGNSV
jgi:rhodanese-related sulfurtransferase